MAGWIASVFTWLLGFGGGALRRVVRWTQRVLDALWHQIQAVARAAAARLRPLWSYVSALARSLNAWVDSLYSSIRDLYNRYVPAIVRNWFNSAIRFARDLINRVVSDIFRLINSWVRWLRDRIDDVRGWARSWINWLRDRIDGLRSFASGLIRNLGHVLGGPGRLARWLIGALVGVLWDYVRANETRIFRWARNRSLAFTLFAAGRLESLIRRVL